MSTTTDFEYLRALNESADKQEILQDLMTAYGRDVWNFAYSLTRKWDQADDITQDVFIKVYRNLFSFRQQSSVKTWLLSITRNTAIDYRRSAFYRKVTLMDRFTPQGEHPSPEREVLETMAVNEMWSLVMVLPVKYREAILLYAHHQLSMKEMAQILGVNESTVKSRLHHARVQLSKMKERHAHASDR